MNTEPKMNPPPTPTPEISEVSQRAVNRLITYMEDTAELKQTREYENRGECYDAWEKQQAKLHQIIIIHAELKTSNDLFKQKYLNKWNAEFQKRMPDGYYIQDDCWNIIKSFVIDYTLVGFKKLNIPKQIKVGWYIMKNDAKKVFHNVNWKNQTWRIMKKKKGKKGKRPRFINKKTTNEQYFNQYNQLQKECRYNLSCIDFVAEILQVVKVCNKTIKVISYNLIGDTLWKQDSRTDNTNPYFEPYVMRINKNANGVLNYKTDCGWDYEKAKNDYNNGINRFNLSGMLEIDKYSLNVSGTKQERGFSQQCIQYRKLYLEAKPLYLKMVRKYWSDKGHKKEYIDAHLQRGNYIPQWERLHTNNP